MTINFLGYKTSLQHLIESFKDFSETQIDSKNSGKIHGHLWKKKYTSVNFFRIFEAYVRLKKNSRRHVQERVFENSQG